MKGRSSLVLLLSIVVLGAFIWIQDSWRGKAPSKRHSQIRLFDLDMDTLVSVEFTRTNEVVRCLKENGVWMAGSGADGIGRADVEMVQRLVASLNSLGKGTTITRQHLSMRGIDISEYGFNNPSIEIAVVDNKGRREWQVGRKTPLGDMVYVRAAGGEEIYTVVDAMLDVIPASQDVLRDRTIFFGEMAGVRRVEVRGADGFIQIAKDSKEGWVLQQPLSAPVDEAEVGIYLQKLFHLRVEEFLHDNVSDFSIYGLQDGTQQISLSGADGASRMLVLGDKIADKPGYVYARRADDTSVFKLKEDVLDLLNVTADRFRDAVVLPLPAKKISHVSIARGESKVELTMDDHGVWFVTKPVSWQADADVVLAVLKQWEEAVVTDFEVSGNEEPEWVLQFGSREIGETNTISILPARGRKDGLLIRRNSDPTLYQINIASMEDHLVDPLSFKDKIIWHFDKKEVRSLTVERDAVGRQVVERNADGAFAPAETNTLLRVDNESLGRLLTGLQVVSASDYVAYDPKDLSIYGLTEPSMLLQIGFSGTNQLGRVLLVGWETEEGFFAMVKGRDVVFLLNRTFVESVSVNLLSESETTTPLDG
jgi:hypothetical protein